MNDHPYSKYYLAFSYAPGIGPRTFQKLLTVFKNPESAYFASATDIAPIINNKKTLQDFLSFRLSFMPDRTLTSLINKNIQIIHPGLNHWPKQMGLFSGFPICLYARGNTELLTSGKKIVAIIGSRKPTLYGRETANKFAKELSINDVIILSGLALGIDTIAHQTTLNGRKSTIAVLGSGLDRMHPQQNLGLYRDIINNSGLVLSEFPPDMPPAPGNFPARNRIISALSSGVLVIEGNRTSGTRITAQHAAEQGRDVFAVPGRIDSPLSHAPNLLIQQGAHLVESPSYILEFYGLRQNPEPKILKLLKHRSQTARELSLLINLPLDKITNELTELEIEGHIIKNPDNTYSVLQY